MRFNERLYFLVFLVFLFITYIYALLLEFHVCSNLTFDNVCEILIGNNFELNTMELFFNSFDNFFAIFTLTLSEKQRLDI